ncbi:MAG: STAS domain-containing protein [Burkholderiaceae bacterium]|jgi:phospholipid transport system transporter-binding protein|nr:STAS domain-containing protein [Polynucleobacter sp.]MCF8187385.1 STAS domain-containing protein [Sulfuritalea sp.]
MSFAPTSITMADAADVLREGMEAIVQGETTVDLSGLTHFDSSAVSALLAWQRAATDKSVSLELVGLPAGLLSLAKLYSVDTLL